MIERDRVAAALVLLGAAVGTGCGKVTTQLDPDASGTDASASSDGALGANDGAQDDVALLEVVLSGPGTGTVTSSSGSIDCGEVCQAEVPRGSVVTLEASADGEDVFAGWVGPCDGRESCEIPMDVDRVVRAEFAEAPNIAFLFPGPVSADLGGTAGADALCQDAADAADLDGTYIAWLSTEAESAFDRVGDARGWVRPDGKAFANTPEDIVFHPMRLTASGEDTAGEVIFAFTGTLSQENTCDDWSRDDDDALAGYGSTTSIGPPWTNFGSDPCSRSHGLYCFGIDRQSFVEPTRVEGRLAFVTEQVFVPGGGLDAADSLCAAEAQAYGATGSFKALLAVDGQSALSRFDLDGSPWVRVDGAAITDDAGELGQAFWDTAIHQTLNGTYLRGDEVWTGTDGSLSEPGAPEGTCDSWLSDDASVVGRGARTDETHIDTPAFSFPCAEGARLRCLEE
jgi:hypothetical protein